MKVNLNLFNKLICRSEFADNVFKLSAGQAVALTITILATPVLTRIYSPSDFGIFALFLAISAIFGSISCWGYELAIVLPKEDKEAVNLLSLAIVVATVMAILSLMIVILFRYQIGYKLGAPKLIAWLWWIPISVLAGGLFLALSYWSNRNKLFGDLAISRIVRSAGRSVAQLFAGLTTNLGTGGLIGGQLVGQTIGCITLGNKIWRKDYHSIKESTHWQEIYRLAVKHRKFPIYSSWTNLLTAASAQLPAILLVYFFNPSVAGLYALVYRLVQVPASLISQSVTEVFFQKVVQEYNRTGNSRRILKKVLKHLFGIAVLPMLLVLLLGSKIFAFILGSEWFEAGKYAQILAPLFLAQFVISPVSNILLVTGAQRTLLFWRICYILIIGFAFVIGGLMKNMFICLGLYSFMGSVMFIILLLLCFRRSEQAIKR